MSRLLSLLSFSVGGGGADSHLCKAEYSTQFLESGHRIHMIHWILGKTGAQCTDP